MRTIGLRPLTAAEYDEWVPRAIAVYAAEHARAGSRPADRALAMAEQEFAELLPTASRRPSTICLSVS